MITSNQARARVCVFAQHTLTKMRVRDRLVERFMLRFFPWWSRWILYRHKYCCSHACMYWNWANADQTPDSLGFCRVQDSMMVEWTAFMLNNPVASRPYPMPATGAPTPQEGPPRVTAFSTVVFFIGAVIGWIVGFGWIVTLIRTLLHG